MSQKDIFASAQIVAFNPILKESLDVRIQYFLYLKKMLKIAKYPKNKYTEAQLALYKETLCEDIEVPKYRNHISFDPHFCYLLPYDLAMLLEFRSMNDKSKEIKKIIYTIIGNFKLPKEQLSFLYREFDAAFGNLSAWKDVMKNDIAKGFDQYLNLVRKNISFIQSNPYNILITATMSAGKSTLINSLVGKNISLMQNMSCTSKIHTIISKPLEDGVTSEDDHELSLNASQQDLLDDNEENDSSNITVGTYFNGELGGKRIVLFDSPGVNSSENEDHKQISHQMVKSKNYKLMLYVLNATQLGTTDDEQYLEAIKQQIGETKIIFVMNKADQLISEDDNFLDSIEKQKKFLISKGFKDPLICPVSSRAAYLVKKSKVEELRRIERREMENLMDKFELQRLSDYYEKNLGCSHISSNNETDELFVNCGFSHFEKIITNLYNGGKKNGTDLY